MFSFLPRRLKREDDPEQLKKQLHTIEDISSLLLSGSPLEDSLNEITKVIPSVLGVSLVAILLWDEKNKHFKLAKTSIPRAAKMFVELTMGTKIYEIVYPSTNPDNLFVKSIRTKSIQSTQDVEDALLPLMSKEKAANLVKIVKTQIKTLVSVPMAVKGDIIGAVALGWKEDELTAHDKHLLSTFANQASIAIYNSKLYNQVQDQIRDLEERNDQLQSIANFTNNIISTLDPSRLAQSVIDSVNEIYPDATVTYAKIDKSGRYVNLNSITQNKFTQLSLSFLPRSVFEYSVDLTDPDLQDTVIVRAIKENRIVMSDDLIDLTKKLVPDSIVRKIQKVTGIRSVVVIPIDDKDRPKGVLCILNKHKGIHEYTDLELSTLSIIADQIGIATENSNLYNQTQKQAIDLLDRNRQLEVISEFTNTVITSLETESIAQESLDGIENILGYRGGVYIKLDEEQQSLKLYRFTNNELIVKGGFLMESKFEPVVLPLDAPEYAQSTIMRSFKENKILITDSFEIAVKGLISRETSAELKEILQIESIVSIPVRNQTSVVGVLLFLVQDKKPDQLSDLEIDTMAIISGQIGIALNNANLFTQVQKALDEAKVSNLLLQQKYQEERDMIGILGHELRTPLAIAKSNLELLSSKINSQHSIDLEYAQKKINTVHDAIVRESRIVEAALATSHVDNNKIHLLIHSVDVAEIIREYGINPNKREAESKGLDLYFENSDESIFINTDGTKFQEIVTNLINNAVKYTNQGHVKVWIEKDEEYLYVHVEDSGIGIAESDIAKLGGRFHRIQQYTKDNESHIVRPGGTGLGLYIIKAYLKAMGGELRVSSKFGKGSTFTAVIPLDIEEVIEHDKSHFYEPPTSNDDDLFVQMGLSKG